MRMQSELDAHEGEPEPSRVDRFLALFNDVHKGLRRLVGQPKASFRDALIRYSGKVVGWEDEAAFLDQVRQLRNTLVHEQQDRIGYLAVPTVDVLRRLEEIKHDLVDPDTALDSFAKPVTCFEASDQLSTILQVVAEKAFSQFPIYTGASFSGLLTENGVTRWLAHCVSEGGSQVTLEEAAALDVIRSQEEAENYRFVPQSMPVREIRFLFATSEWLEAVLITETGRVGRDLIGIGTRWDLLHIQPSKTLLVGK